MAQKVLKILAADDEEITLKFIKTVFDGPDYEVITARDGVQAISLTLKHHPDLIIMDYLMPIKNGFEAVDNIRALPAFMNTPIIILTAAGDKITRMKAYELDVDDIIAKPVDAEDFKARAKLLVRRSEHRMDSNPLTKLPGNPSIQARINKEILSGRKFAIIYSDLNNFKEYNDAYGFSAGDNILLKTAQIITKAAFTYDKDAFIGNIGGDDFVIITAFEHAQNMAEIITAEMEKQAPSFYNEADRERRYISAISRQGERKNFPLLSISVAVVHNNLKELTSYAQVAFIATELKHYAKSWGGNFIAVDRRYN